MCPGVQFYPHMVTDMGLHDFDWADDVVVEISKFFRRHPKLLMLTAANDLHFVSKHERAIHQELRDKAQFSTSKYI